MSKHTALSLAAGLTAMLATQAWASGAADVRLPAPRFTQTAGQTRVQGEVCRTGPQPLALSRTVTVEVLGDGQAGRPVNNLSVYGDVRARGGGCFYYSGVLNAAAAGAVKVCVDAAGAVDGRDRTCARFVIPG